jgi:biphenyl-2,3-diol 1,2-dioxygenase
MGAVSQLGYWGFEVSDLAAWEHFATDVLGLAVGRRLDDGGLRLRLDEYDWRIELEPGPADDLAYVGWEVKDARALGELGEQLARGGVHVEQGKPELCALRQVQGLLHCSDPAGIPTELYWGPRIAGTAFCSPRVASGFVAGAQGAGHMVVSSPDGDAVLGSRNSSLAYRSSRKKAPPSVLRAICSRTAYFSSIHWTAPKSSSPTAESTQ